MLEAFVIGAPVAGKAVLPLVSFVGKKLSGDELKKVERSFHRALRAERRERGEVRFDRPGPLRRAARTGREATRSARNAFSPAAWSDKGSEKSLAHWLAWTWGTASIEAADREREERERSGRPLPSTWREALIAYLEDASKEGTGAEPPANASDDQKQAWAVRRDAWLWTLGVEEKIDDERARDWATKVASRIVTIWRESEVTGRLIAQLNHDSSQNLIEEIAYSGGDIARSLHRLVSVGIPMGLLGGGAVALAVLFIDKG